MALSPGDVVRLACGSDRGSNGLGGKGSSLGRMVAGGFPVPPTAVIDTDIYREVIADPALAAFLDGLRSAAEPPAAHEVDEAFLDVELPASVAVRIVGATCALGPSVAVRSSASVEDLGEQSFAGQYRSFLDVPNAPDAILEAVRLVWASLWHPAPWAYRRAWAVPDDDVAMAVVVMAMVPAVEAGVAFTVDPGGGSERLRIEAVDGVAESLVSGERTPRTWLVERQRHAPLPEDAPAYLTRLRELALDLEATEGQALDIEWAWDGAGVWLVQSRPITVGPEAGDGFDTAVDDHELTSAGIAEMLPGVLPPLVWELNSFIVEQALRSVLDSLGALPPVANERRIVRRVHGRAALDLDLLKAAAAAIPGASDADIERQYFGGDARPQTDALDRKRPAGTIRAIGRDLRATTVRRRAVADAGIVGAAVARMRDRLPVLTDLDDAALLAYRLRLIDLGVRAMTVELAVASAAVGAYTRLESVLGRHLATEEASAQAQRVTRGAALPPPPQLGASRSVFAGPRWDEADRPVPSARPPADDDEASAARDELRTRLRSEPSWRRVRILTGQVVDVRMHVVQRLVSDAVMDLGRRETTKADVLELGGEVRRVHLEIGRRLMARGMLHDPLDVDLLAERELHRALDGVRVAPALLGRRRRWLDARRADPILPPRFVGIPSPPEPPEPTGDRLFGTAASPGRHTGRAVVVSDPTGVRLAPGSVLVAEATDAAWSPLFVDAGAIVVERGGPLSHAAIVARELGVPAVLDVHGATSFLDGRIVSVDGDHGTVDVENDGAER